MFLKRMRRRVGRKRLTYWALVESVRTERGPRQRVVAHLGELRPGERAGWAKLACGLAKKNRPAPSLFDPPAYPEPLEPRYAEVNLKGIRLKNLRDFGDVWLAWGLWRLLGLDELLSRRMPAGREDVPWALVAAILTIARFCEPSSELHIEDTWYPRTALEDLLGVESAKVHTDRLYQGLDQLLPHKDVIEGHLKQRLGDLFDLKYDLLLYDITSTYFEGLCLGNPMARRGYSRDNRPDCLQVCIGLIVTDDGMPLGYEVFDGNTNDSTTVQQMVERIEAKYGRAHRVWVMDRGMVSEANLAFLRERGGSYIVGTPKAMLRQFERHLTEKDWQEVQAGVEVKLVAGPNGEETFVLARSRDRREKEKAMHDRFLQRMEDGLGRLQRSAESGRLKDSAVAHQRLGRLKERYWRASGAFDVQIRKAPEPTAKAKLTVTWKRKPRWSDWTAVSEGCYLLRTNLAETDPCTLWKRYIQLTEAEWAFRITKDELAIRPIWHQKADRVKGHILVCFLAYVLWKTLSAWMDRGGLGSAPRTLLEEFARIKSGDVILPTRDGDGQPGPTLRLRCVTHPDEYQRVFLSRLGLTLPQRLRWVEEEPNAEGPGHPPM
ncbi:MAG: IS1634 family transposase [Syntrophobacterales bacterium]|nr:MAG: IS1634 family transposase [Syntrophobacterales bacterium]